MLFGDKSTFAVECEVRETIDTFVYCNFRFWIVGEAIGDWQEDVVLGTLIHSADVFLLYQGDRGLDMAEGMSAQLLWQHINKVATSDDANNLRLSLEGRYRQRYLLHEIAPDSVATVCEVVVVERKDGLQRLLWKIRGGKDLQEMTLPSLTVDRAVGDFCKWAVLMAP